MYKLDTQERLIVRELIRDPQISDNKISLRTNVPLKTVNRKRKLLEEKGYLNYYCFLDLSSQGTGSYGGRCLLITLFKEGITRKRILDTSESSQKAFRFFPKHILHTFVGEMDGSAACISIVESLRQEDLLEIYNAEIVPEFQASLGQACIKNTLMIPLTTTLRTMRNYLPSKNVKDGKVREDWSNDLLFVDE